MRLPLVVVAAFAAGACTPPPELDAGLEPAPDELLIVAPSGRYAPVVDRPPTADAHIPDGAGVTVSPGVTLPLDGAGETEVVELWIPPGTRSVQLIAFTEPDDIVVLKRAVSPEGDVVVDPDARPADFDPDGNVDGQLSIARGFPGQWFSPNRVTAAATVGAFRLPSTPDVALPPGVWQVQFSSSLRARDGNRYVISPGQANAVHVLALAVDEGPTDVTLPIQLHLTGAGGLTAENWRSDEYMSGVIDTATTVLANAQIDVRVVMEDDVTDPGADVITLGDGCAGGELDTILEGIEASAGLPVVVTERFECFNDAGLDFGEFISGFSSGIPTTSWVSSRRSAVVLARASLPDDPPQLGRALAHEIGHALGLFHSGENPLGWGGFDPISDTPEDSRVGENLMYYSLSDGTDSISDGQAWVMRSSPWLLRD